MNVQIQYFEGCPNHRPAVELVRRVLRALNVDATIEEVEVDGPDDARELNFLGSPTILVDGVDVEPDARGRTDFGFACRTYDGKGLPARDMVVAAVMHQSYVPDGRANAPATENCCANEEGPKGESGLLEQKAGSGRWVLGGSLIAALVASACCWLPLSLVALGASAGGAGIVFERTRPVFLGLAAVLLALSFYFIYVRREKCESGSACEAPGPRRKRINGVLFWIATVGVISFAFFPSYVGVFQPARAVPLGVEGSTSAELVTLKVDGMSCEGCAVNLQSELVKVPGVLDAEVLFEEGRALVSVNSALPPSTDLLLAAVEKAGYKGSLTKP